jgi:hypothetical protein
VLVDFVGAAAAVAGIVIALKAFQIPNCTSVGEHVVLSWASRISLALATIAFTESIIGIRGASRLSKAIALLSLFAAILVWVICRWKLNTIQTMAC